MSLPLAGHDHAMARELPGIEHRGRALVAVTGIHGIDVASGDRATLLAATLVAQTAIDLLRDPTLAAEAWREFRGEA